MRNVDQLELFPRPCGATIGRDVAPSAALGNDILSIPSLKGDFSITVFLHFEHFPGSQDLAVGIDVSSSTTFHTMVRGST